MSPALAAGPLFFAEEKGFRRKFSSVVSENVQLEKVEKNKREFDFTPPSGETRETAAVNIQQY